jgi:DNA polymerase III subunit epsilon
MDGYVTSTHFRVVDDMSLITIIDTETTGVDPENNLIIEIAAILYSLTHAAPVESVSWLLSCMDNPAIAVNGILPELTALSGDLRLCLDYMESRSIAYVAHNAPFDKSFLKRDAIPFVCSMRDIEWPVPCGSKALVAIALAHGIGVASAHRAMADCDTISRLLTRVHEMGVDLEQLIARAMRPKVLVRALVSYDDRQLAKDRHFNWTVPPGYNKKVWNREYPEGEIPIDLPFETKVLS